jgi:hypothetical protein
MMALGVVWRALLFVELTGRLTPGLGALGTAIWAAFLVDFALRLLLAPRKLAFLRRNWLLAISLAVPALRFVRALRVLQVARGARGLRLVRILAWVRRSCAGRCGAAGSATCSRCRFSWSCSARRASMLWSATPARASPASGRPCGGRVAWS